MLTFIYEISLNKSITQNPSKGITNLKHKSSTKHIHQGKEETLENFVAENEQDEEIKQVKGSKQLRIQMHHLPSLQALQ